MGNKLYVGNLPYTFNDSDMEQAFSAFGSVQSAVIQPRFARRPHTAKMSRSSAP